MSKRVALAVSGVIVSTFMVAQARADAIAATSSESCSGSFSPVPSADPGTGGNVLNAVATFGPSDAWAVGQTVNNTTGLTSQPLLEHWNGSSWTSVSDIGEGLPVPLPLTGQLNGVGGSGSTDVWAVGSSGLILHWDGSSWTLVTTPVSADDLHAVWAASPTDAWAVGDQTNGASTSGLTEHWDGSSWQVVAGQDSVVTSWSSTSGASAQDVWAFGTGPQFPWIETEHWDGATWSLVTPADPMDGGPTRASAGGIADTATGGPFISASEPPVPGNSPGAMTLEEWNGSSWAYVASGSTWPSNGGQNLTSAGASALDNVWFAGSIQRHASATDPTLLPAEPYALHFDGIHVAEVPSTAGSVQGQYNGIAADANQAWAVGYQVQPGSNVQSTLIETNCTGAPAASVPEAPAASLLSLLGFMTLAVPVIRRRRGVVRHSGRD